MSDSARKHFPAQAEARGAALRMAIDLYAHGLVQDDKLTEKVLVAARAFEEFLSVTRFNDEMVP